MFMPYEFTFFGSRLQNIGLFLGYKGKSGAFPKLLRYWYMVQSEELHITKLCPFKHHRQYSLIAFERSAPRFGLSRPLRVQSINSQARLPDRQSKHLPFIACFAVIVFLTPPRPAVHRKCLVLTLRATPEAGREGLKLPSSCH